LKLAFVVQRYGLEVGGGAELHCRWLAERLARRHAVEVFTTRALDYVDWANAYPEGTVQISGIPVHRFPVKARRRMREFASISNLVFEDRHTRDEELHWVRANGPYSPALVDAVKAAALRFDLIFFYCYRYYHSFHALPPVRDRAVLVPTAEDDPAIRLGVSAELLRMPRGMVYLTEEEQALVEDLAGNQDLPSIVIGSGVELPPTEGLANFRARHGIDRPFLLYVGRLDKNKGCLTLFAYFQKFLAESRPDLELVLAGPKAIEVPDHPRIRYIGFIPEAEKAAALRECLLLVMPSPYESLSIVTLEAWKLEVPVLANSRCRVLAGQCLRSNGGLLYEGYEEFAEGLGLLLEDPELLRVLGRQGREYVDREYSWERVEAKVESLLDRLAPAAARG
jgi:glycosyltransferase involved in cell wall biosynthesis